MAELDYGPAPSRPLDVVPKAYVDIKGVTVAKTVFSNRPTGTWAAQDTGQPVTQTGSSPMSVTGGYLTHPQLGAGAAGYAETNIGQKVGRIGATFQFPDSSAAGSGTVTLVVPTSSWVTGGVGSSTAACHFYVTATQWAYQLYDGSNLTTLKSGTLALSAAVDYDLEIVFDGNTATFYLPDGSMSSVTDARIGGYTAQTVLFELYEQGSSAVPAKVSHVRADGVRNAAPPAQVLARSAAARVATYVQQAQPTAPGPYVWYQTNAAGQVVQLYIENGM